MLLEGAHVEVGFAAGLQVTSELDLLLLYAQTLYILLPHWSGQACAA